MEKVITETSKYSSYEKTGVERLGEIPNHWKVDRIKNQIRLLTGFPFKSDKYADSGIKLVRG